MQSESLFSANGIRGNFEKKKAFQIFDTLFKILLTLFVVFININERSDSMKSTKLNSRTWFSILIFGFFGQLAWVIENMYFNVFLYNTVTDDPNAIAAMVAASAIAATVTTLFMGALSDRIGKRKIFITIGYILWGFVTMSFALLTVENTHRLFPTANAVTATAAIIIIMDCVMTFFGSTANDAALNAWITDVTDTTNRGRVETVLSALPLAAMLVVFGALDTLTRQGNWKLFYIIVGGLVTLGGIVGTVSLRDKPQIQTSGGNYFKNIFYGFKPSTIKSNQFLYIAFCAFAVFNISYQVFMPYIIIYIQRTLKIDNYALPLGAILIIAALISMLSGTLMDKFGKHTFLIPSLIVLVLASFSMYFVTGKSIALLILTASVMMGANLLVSAGISGTIRDYTPEGKAGLFQGVKMIFGVLIPMVTGPYIGAAVIKSSNETYVDLGVVKQVPTHNIFIACAIVALFALIPMIALVKNAEKNKKKQVTSYD